MTRMPKTLMPKRRGGSGMEGGRRKTERVQSPGAVTSDGLSPRLKILHRTATRVKIHRDIVIRCKLEYRNQVLDEVRGDKNIIKME